MTGFPFLHLSKRWRLAYDPNQWIVQTRRGKGWKGVAFVGSHKGVLERVLRELGVVGSPQGQDRTGGPTRTLPRLAGAARIGADAIGSRVKKDKKHGKTKAGAG